MLIVVIPLVDRRKCRLTLLRSHRVRPSELRAERPRTHAATTRAPRALPQNSTLARDLLPALSPTHAQRRTHSSRHWLTSDAALVPRVASAATPTTPAPFGRSPLRISEGGLGRSRGARPRYIEILSSSRLISPPSPQPPLKQLFQNGTTVSRGSIAEWTYRDFEDNFLTGLLSSPTLPEFMLRKTSNTK